MAIGIDHLHSSRSSDDMFKRANSCPGVNVVRFVPCRVTREPELVRGNVSICVHDNLPEPALSFPKGSLWVLSEKMFFTDGDEILLGWLKRPTKELLEQGVTPVWESVDGRSFGLDEVKGWQRRNNIRITIDR